MDLKDVTATNKTAPCTSIAGCRLRRHHVLFLTSPGSPNVVFAQRSSRVFTQFHIWLLQINGTCGEKTQRAALMQQQRKAATMLAWEHVIYRTQKKTKKRETLLKQTFCFCHGVKSDVALSEHCLSVHCGGRHGGGATDGRHLKHSEPRHRARRCYPSNYPSLPRPTYLLAVDRRTNQ